jgi:hypothetical protein
MFQPGLYSVRVTGQGFSKALTGTDQFFLQVEPEMFHNGGSDEPCDNYSRTIRWNITTKTVDRVRADLERIGFTGDKWTLLDPSTPNGFSFVGQVIHAECKHEPGFKDPSTMKETWELPYEGGAKIVESDSSVAKKLDTLFGKKFAKPAAKAASKAAAPKQTAGASTDDVPF